MISLQGCEEPISDYWIFLFYRPRLFLKAGDSRHTSRKKHQDQMRYPLYIEHIT